MSPNDSIRKLLTIKDENIHFEDNFYSESLVKNVPAKIFHAVLTSKPPIT